MCSNSSISSSNSSSAFLPPSILTSKDDSRFFYGALRENIVALLLGLIIFTTSFALLKSITSQKEKSSSPPFKRRSLKFKVKSEFNDDEIRLKDPSENSFERVESFRRPLLPVNPNSNNFEVLEMSRSEDFFIQSEMYAVFLYLKYRMNRILAEYIQEATFLG